MKRSPASTGRLPLDGMDDSTAAPCAPYTGAAANCAAASGPETSGVCELPDAAASLSAADRTRMVEALDQIIAQRHRQLDYGHSLDRDLAADDSERRLLQMAVREAHYTQENVTLRVGGAEWFDLAARRAAKSAALLLAFIELMLERKAQLDLEPPAAPIEQGDLNL
jgi:hypothetical protein